MSPSTACRFIPLGGLGEIGMNCMAVEHEAQRIVIDCGLAFDGRGLGADVLHADFRYLLEAPERLLAIVITHGHEDHIGAVHHLLEELQERGLSVPVYGPPYALALIGERLAYEAQHLEVEMHRFAPGDRITIGPFEIEPYRVTHSIPDCTGLILRTPAGTVVHSGDFKIDDDPTDGEHFDFDRLRAVRDEEGVRLLLSDSTNAITEGRSGDERPVADHLCDLVRDSPGRVCVTLFASNVHRIRALVEAARKTDRKLCLLGRSLDRHARLSQEHGYLDDLADVQVSAQQAADIDPAKLIVLATGTQGEPRAAWARLAKGTHPNLRLEPPDRVIHSARIIPGNELEVYELINALERRGIDVLWRRMDEGIHVSGHAHRGEQRQLFEAVRPDSFVPVHGTFVHLKNHADVARECGVADVLTVENGAVFELRADGPLRVVDNVRTGRVYRERGQAVHPAVLKDRALLAELGLAVVTAAVDLRGKPTGPLEILTRGILHEEEEQDLLDDACEYVHEALMRRRWNEERPDLDSIEAEARRALKRFFAKHFRKKPLCYAMVMQP